MSLAFNESFGQPKSSENSLLFECHIFVVYNLYAITENNVLNSVALEPRVLVLTSLMVIPAFFFKLIVVKYLTLIKVVKYPCMP